MILVFVTIISMAGLLFLASRPDMKITMRETCLFCVSKHVAQAIVLMQEAFSGYPIHRWLMGLLETVRKQAEEINGQPDTTGLEALRCLTD